MPQDSNPHLFPKSEMPQDSNPHHFPKSGMPQESIPHHFPKSGMPQDSIPHHFPKSGMPQDSNPHHFPKSGQTLFNGLRMRRQMGYKPIAHQMRLQTAFSGEVGGSGLQTDNSPNAVANRI